MNLIDCLHDVPAATKAAFLAYHKSNPEVWREFERFALEAANKRKHYGAKSIMERVRWESEIAYGKDFKANNNFTAYYSRIFAAKYPLFDLFEFRKLKGLKAA
jgi:hypothetical protein